MTYGEPAAQFQLATTTPPVDQTVVFQNTSIGTATWSWDFGDPASGAENTSTLASPTHKYLTAGLYTTTLTAHTASRTIVTTATVAVGVTSPCENDGGVTLPINAGHSFCVSLSAADPRTGNTGPGLAIPQNDVFGYFSIPTLTFNPSNPEVFVKILDGRTINGSFWIFYGGLTDLEYTITVTDFDTGDTQTYTKAGGSSCGGFDTSLFPGVTSPPVAQPSNNFMPGDGLSPIPPDFSFRKPGQAAANTCPGSDSTLCLNSSHSFTVYLSARDPRTGKTANGKATPQNDLFGYFSIPDLTNNPQNPEVFVKILDGTKINGRYWVFYGGLTDLTYTITVQDNATGRLRQYNKPAGSPCGGFDTKAF